MMFELFLGHLLGDYLLQTEEMALNKSKNTKLGWYYAILHCVIYTASVCVIMQNFDLIWIIVVFLSHFPIDKFSLGEYYMHYIKGYGMKQYIDDVNNSAKWAYLNNTPGNQMLKGGFTAYVYAMTDNTIHLLLMWGAYHIMY
jgi:hypothetical protein